MIFHELTFAWSWGKCLNTRPIGIVLEHLPMDPASVNAMKHICMIVSLSYFILFQPNLQWKGCKNIKNIPFLTLTFSKQNDVDDKRSNVITSLQRHGHAQSFCEQKHRQNDQSGAQRYLYITSCKYLGAYLKCSKVQSHVQTACESPVSLIWQGVKTAIRIGFYARIHFDVILKKNVT